MSERGVLYVVWGDQVKPLLERSMTSVQQHHPELPIHVHELPASSTLLDKASMARFSPFTETLFLDVDTVVLGNLDFAFRKAAQVGLALSICECPWARRYGGLQGDMVEYNTGVLFFTPAARPVFDSWESNVKGVDSSILFYAGTELNRMPLNDQAGFALAIEETGFCPYVLPFNWNLRPRWHTTVSGPIKIWHDYMDVPPKVLAWNAQQSQADAIISFAKLNF